MYVYIYIDIYQLFNWWLRRWYSMQWSCEHVSNCCWSLWPLCLNVHLYLQHIVCLLFVSSLKHDWSRYQYHHYYQSALLIQLELTWVVLLMKRTHLCRHLHFRAPWYFPSATTAETNQPRHHHVINGRGFLATKTATTCCVLGPKIGVSNGVCGWHVGLDATCLLM